VGGRDDASRALARGGAVLLDEDELVTGSPGGPLRARGLAGAASIQCDRCVTEAMTPGEDWIDVAPMMVALAPVRKRLGGSVKRTREVLHIPLVNVEVVEHVYMERRCPICTTRNVPKAELSGEVIGRSRLSTSSMAMIAAMKEVGRMPLRAIK